MENQIKFSVDKASYTRTKTLIDLERVTDSHCHDFYEILFVREGKGRFILEGKEYPIHPRMLLVIPPLEYHSVSLSSSSVYERSVIHFTETDLSEEVRSYLSSFRTEEKDSGFYIADVNSEPILSLFSSLDFVPSLKEPDSAILAKMLLSELVLLLSVTGSDKYSPADDDLGARVIRYLNEHIERDVSLDALAKRFFVSKYYLCRAFKKYNGISVHGYVNQKRIMYAKQLIESGETASGAAYKVGFGDYSAFYRAYIKLVGKSPTSSDK